MADQSVGVCLLGCGVIGGGVVQIIQNQRDLIRQRTGIHFDLTVVDKDPNKTRDIKGVPIATDAAPIIDDPKTKIVIELIGGTGIAGQLVERALNAGKSVVTANKSLLAARGPELFALARKKGGCIGFEASCAGGIPIIAALTYSLTANRIDALIGIVNGTCNFILTQMTRNNWTYAQAVAEAQKAGFAEADPTLDVSGRDAAQKLAILSGLAFNLRVKESDIHIEGIDKLQDADIRLAGELSYVIKLLAIAQRHGDKVSLRVHPALVHQDDLLAEVSGSFNAVSIWGHALGHAMFYGRGAGRTPTASAVVADAINIALGITPLAFQNIRIFPDQVPDASILPFEQLSSRYYLRLMARDEPGVLAQVTKILGSHGISLSAVLQHEITEGQFVPVVITTHLAGEGAVQASLREIDGLKAINAPTVCLRIVDQPKEFAAA